MSEPTDPVDPFPTQAQRPVSPFPPLDPPSDWIDTADAHDLPTRENALVALGRVAFPPAPPLDDEGQAARARRWTSQILLTVCLFLLIFNAGSVQTWARQQPPSWGQSTIDQLATVWADQLALLGADQPVEGVRRIWQDALALRFSESSEDAA